MCSWWWAKEPPETCRASAEINKSKKTLHLVGCNLEFYYDARTYGYQPLYLGLIKWQGYGVGDWWASVTGTSKSTIESKNNFNSWFQILAVFWMLYVFFWVIPWRLDFTCRRFGHRVFHLHRQVGVEWLGLRNVGAFSSQAFFPLWIPLHFLNIVILHLSAYEDGTECSETSAYKIQTQGNYPEENIKFNSLLN